MSSNEQNKFPSERGVSEGRGVFIPENVDLSNSDGVLSNYLKLPYNPKLKSRAKELRKAGILSEVLFWNKVKNKQFLDLDFHRQKIIGNYIVDFFCPGLRLVVEIDGYTHNLKDGYDEKRDDFLKSLGLIVVRFKDIEIKKNIDNVMMNLAAFCSELSG